MPVEIKELSIEATVVQPGGLLSPAAIEQIVEVVLQRLDARDRADDSRDTELDLRSVVEQQRARGGPR